MLWARKAKKQETQRDKARQTGPSEDGQYWPEVDPRRSGEVYSSAELSAESISGIRFSHRSRDQRRFWP